MACTSCGQLVRARELRCPFCSASFRVVVVVLGLSLVSMSGCMGKSAGSSHFESRDSASTEDGDGDTYSPAQGDCDDENPDLNPAAAETIGDGLDSNCDGEDDT